MFIKKENFSSEKINKLLGIILSYKKRAAFISNESFKELLKVKKVTATKAK